MGGGAGIIRGEPTGIKEPSRHWLKLRPGRVTQTSSSQVGNANGHRPAASNRWARRSLCTLL